MPWEEKEANQTQPLVPSKGLIFTEFTKTFDAIKKALTTAGVPFCVINGATTATKREQVVKKFQNEAQIRILLLTPKSAASGLNLTAADHVFFMEPWLNTSLALQAMDRANRLGQLHRVKVIRLVLAQTVETQMINLLTTALQSQISVSSSTLLNGEAPAKLQTSGFSLEQFATLFA